MLRVCYMYATHAAHASYMLHMHVKCIFLFPVDTSPKKIAPSNPQHHSSQLPLFPRNLFIHRARRKARGHESPRNQFTVWRNNDWAKSKENALSREKDRNLTRRQWPLGAPEWGKRRRVARMRAKWRQARPEWEAGVAKGEKTKREEPAESEMGEKGAWGTK